MKKIKILVITIAVLFAVVYTLNLEYFVKGVRIVYLNGESTVFIDDLKYFDYETIESPEEKSPWKESENKTNNFSSEFEDYNQKMGTAAYLVIHNDTIVGEKYYQDYSVNSSTNSFSMAKTFVSLMMAKAYEQGLRTLTVQVKGPGSGRETALRSLQSKGFKILSIKDTTPMPHNGARPPKRRRV